MQMPRRIVYSMYDQTVDVRQRYLHRMIECILLLIESGANVNHRCEVGRIGVRTLQDGASPLHLVTAASSVQVMQALVEAGADVNAYSPVRRVPNRHRSG